VKRRTIAASVTAAALASTLTACKPAPDARASSNTTASTKTTTPACTVNYGPNQAGISASGHKVDAGVTFICNGPDIDPLVSLTLAYIPPGTGPADDQEAPGAAYHNPNPSSWTADAPCQPGDYALHVLYSADVNGTLVSDQQWGKTATVTASDCARG
jgi:hypothetical protein